MFASLEQIVDDAAEAAGVVIPEIMPEEEPADKKPVSKSARVREYLEDNPGARNKDVAIALAEYGVRSADVANVKAGLRKKAAKSGKSATSSSKTSKPSAPTQEAASAMIDASIQLDLLESGIEFVRRAGGINEAQHVLSVIRRIRSL